MKPHFSLLQSWNRFWNKVPRVAWPFKSVNSVLKVFFILHVFIRVIRLHQLEGGPVYNLLRFELQENIINNFT